VSRSREGERTLHLYHDSIWLSAGRDLEPSSFEMPVDSNETNISRKEIEHAAKKMRFRFQQRTRQRRDGCGAIGWKRDGAQSTSRSCLTF
jgi:hypothetical protein